MNGVGEIGESSSHEGEAGMNVEVRHVWLVHLHQTSEARKLMRGSEQGGHPL
jgi:hypothetical protein